MNKHAIRLGGALVALGIATTSWAEPMGPRGDRPDGPPMGGPGVGMEQAVLGRILNNAKVAEELGLTEAQQQTLRDGAFEVQEQRIKLKADLELAAMQQARLLTAESVDEKALMAAVEKTGAVRTELAKTEMRGLLLVRNTLTTEQRDEVRKMMRKHMANRAGDERGRGDRPRPNQERRERGPRGEGPEGGPGPGEMPPPDAPPPAE